MPSLAGHNGAGTVGAALNLAATSAQSTQVDTVEGSLATLATAVDALPTNAELATALDPLATTAELAAAVAPLATSAEISALDAVVDAIEASLLAAIDAVPTNAELATAVAPLATSAGVTSATAPLATAASQTTIIGHVDTLESGIVAVLAAIAGLAIPTATDVRDAVLGATLEATHSVADGMRLLLRTAVGRLTRPATGIGTYAYRDLADTKDAIAGEVTATERTAATVDGT